MATTLDQAKDEEPMWGRSLSADFVKGTWTFEMAGEDWRVSKGAYAIVPNDDYNELVEAKKKAARAEWLLHEVSNYNGGALPDNLREAVLHYFDPAP